MTGKVFGFGHRNGGSYGPSGPDFSGFYDAFDGDTLDGKWNIQPTGCYAFNSITVASGYAHLPIANGGSVGSLLDNRNDYALMSQNITGDFDARAHVEGRNLANTTAQGATGTRMVGLTAQDPDRSGSNYNYVAVGVGRLSGTLKILPLTTDDSGGGSATTTTELAFASCPAPTDGGTAAHLRIVRNGQVFRMYEKGAGSSLDSDAGWTLLYTVDREDDDNPNRGGDGIAVALPDTLEVGFTVWSTLTGPDLSGRAHEFLVKAAPSL